MADKSVRYAPEFKRQMVDLVRSGRSPASLAKEFGPTAWTVALWVRQAKRDTGKGDGGLTTPEREELARLRRENRKPRPGSQPRAGCRSALRVREGEPGHPFGRGHVPIASDFEKRVLCVVGASDERPGTSGSGADREDRGDPPAFARRVRLAEHSCRACRRL